MPQSPLTSGREGVKVAVRLQPGARREGVEGIARDARGRELLKVAVTAPPERGRANAALIRVLAREWRLPKGAIALAGGATDRNKTLLVAGDAGLLMPRLEAWLAQYRE